MPYRQPILRLASIAFTTAVALLTVPAHAVADDFIWIEGEAYSAVAPAGHKVEINDGGRSTYLSGGKWLELKVDAGKVAAEVPDTGIALTYSVNIAKAGEYQIWDRVGFEKVRSPFDWRIDGGVWTTVKPADDTVDVEELNTWNPLGWLPLGKQPLTAGAHKLEFRLTRAKDDKGQDAQVLYTSDALVFAAAPFHPNGPLKPWETSWQDDRDKSAASQVFTAAPQKDADQTSTPLSGVWQIAPDDEMIVDDRLGPIKELPDLTQFVWRGIPVPSDRNDALPEMSYVHRYYLRTRLDIPASLAGRSLRLHFPAINMIATAFVNGKQVGWTKNPFSDWDVDITNTAKVGQVNEIVVGIKDSFYALAGGDNVKHPQYLPFSFWHYNAWSQADMPVLGHHETGILRTPSLIAGGSAYTYDVFAKPSVSAKTLGLDVTIHNPGTQPIAVQVSNAVEPLGGGNPEKTFAPKSVTVPAGQDTVVSLSEPWEKPRLWWPDDPHQYEVVTTLSVDGKPIDRRRTKFGFREWAWNGPNFMLNGIPFHGRADLAAYGQATEEAVALWRKHGQTMQRLWGEGKFSGLVASDSAVVAAGGIVNDRMDPDQALDFYDSHGVVTRRTSFFDGEGADGLYDMNRAALWDNYRTALAAWIKSQRNHPSIFCWSLENEITFINGHVFGQDEITTREHRKTAQIVDALDPTRPYMVDGGNALLDESFPVYGGHYMEPPFNSLPEGAYDRAAMAHRQVWPITKAKPILFGEAFFAGGTEQGDLATIGGEAAFAGKSEAHPAMGLIARMLSEGYRWNDISFQYWFGGESDIHYAAWQPTAVICRDYDWTFGSGQSVKRTLGIFNDTRDTSPITLNWTLTLGGKTVATKSADYTVAPGTKKVIEITLPMPTLAPSLRGGVGEGTRQEGSFSLQLLRAGKTVFTDTKAVSVLNTQAKLPLAPASARLTAQGTAARSGIAVFDPAGTVIPFLKAHGVSATMLTSLNALPETAKVLIVGKDALDPTTSTSSRLAAWASEGRAVIVLEQKNPLRYQGLPGAMDTDTNHGSMAFIEDPDSPLVAGLQQKDFATWSGDGYVYRNAYVKPASGGKSVIECDNRLADSALVQMPSGKGILLLSQLEIGEKLPTSPVAQQILLNMVRYAAGYKLVFKPATLVAAQNSPLTKALTTTGLQYTLSTDSIAAISGASVSHLQPFPSGGESEERAGVGRIAIIDATPTNLHALSVAPAKLDAFTKGGGWLILNNVTPEGLADYNKIVGWNHIMRPFKQEKVGWPNIRNPLTSGLATANIVMGSGKQIFGWSSGQYPDTDAYSYVVDLDDVAPFAHSTYFAWDNAVNNYTMNDGFWPLIMNFAAPKEGKPYEIPITLARPEKITQLTWASDTNYEGATKINVLVNGKTLTFDTQPTNDIQSFTLDTGGPASNLTIQIAEWQHDPAKRSGDGQELLGVDNIWLKAERPAAYYKTVKPMLNIGALVEYPKGNGGIVLCNVKFQDAEANPENAGKKQAIVAAILRNLGAPFSGGKSVIAGANLTYAPLDLSHQANQFTSDRGWFGDKQFSFADLPSGKQSMAGVPYNIYSFTTSPVPTAIMLGGNGIPGNLPDAVRGIPVNRKADALFFLQTARIDSERNDDDRRNKREFEIARYVVHYAGGQSVTIPIRQDFDVAAYKQKTVTPLPGAQIAWSKPYAGTDQTAVAYSMQWNNPHPDLLIESIDLEKGKDPWRGVPALLAITAAVSR